MLRLVGLAENVNKNNKNNYNLICIPCIRHGSKQTKRLEIGKALKSVDHRAVRKKYKKSN